MSDVGERAPCCLWAMRGCELPGAGKGVGPLRPALSPCSPSWRAASDCFSWFELQALMHFI